MKTTKPRKTNFIRNSIMAIAAIIIVGIGGIITYDSTRTYPLGDPSKLEYIGKVDYGCWLVCDANPRATYYYATDMSLDEITHSFFAKAKLHRQPEKSDASGEGVSGVTEYWINYYTDSGDPFDLYYYENPQALINYYHFQKTSRRHVINIDSGSYDLVKGSL